jgi:arginine/ornithine transport system permease protein
MDFIIIWNSLPEFVRGTWLTLQLLAISLFFGLSGAIPLAIMRVSRNPWVSLPVWLYTYVTRGTPMLVQLLVVYYGLPQFDWIRAQWEAGNPFWLLFREPYFCALLAFALNTCAYTIEIIAGSMRSVPHGEIEAARAMGMDRPTLLRRILLPAALRHPRLQQ